ncbi:hypothetical protein ACWD69_24965 [Micromonospora chokoriensis]
MPTITVESAVTDVRVERAFARAVSMLLRHEGVDVNHVITRFSDRPRVYSGPFPLDDCAVVTCVVGEHRDAGFRQRLAATVVAALSSAVPPERIFIRFDLVDPTLHLIGTDVKEAPHER